MKFVHSGYFTLGQATSTAADPGKERDITEIKIVCITMRVVCILDLQVFFIYKWSSFEVGIKIKKNSNCKLIYREASTLNANDPVLSKAFMVQWTCEYMDGHI